MISRDDDLSVLGDYEARVRALCLGAEPSPEALAALGHERFRWLRYRRMVRRRLTDTIEHALPRFSARLGAEAFARLIDRFFAEEGPRSPYIRDVPGEFSTWLERAGDGHDSLPDDGLDLLRFEWALRVVSYAEDEKLAPPSPPHGERQLTVVRPAVLSSSCRLLSLAHAVHHDDPSSGTGARVPTFLCVYRDASTYEVRTLELTSTAHALIEILQAGNRTLVGAIEESATREGVPVDAAFLEATSVLLADLSERGIVLGSLA